LKPRGARYPNSVFATISLAYDSAAATCSDAERLMHLLAFLAPDYITADMIGPTIMDLMERVAATEALAALSIITLKEGNQILIHRLTQEIICQRFHESRDFAAIRTALHETLKNTFTIKRPVLLSPLWEHLLWGVHYDPDPDASIELSYYFDDDQNLDFNLECRKSPTGLKFRRRFWHTTAKCITRFTHTVLPMGGNAYFDGPSRRASPKMLGDLSSNGGENIAASRIRCASGSRGW
jgi:hypothetical protein